MADDKKSDCPCGGEGDVLVPGPEMGDVQPFIRHREDHSFEVGLMKSANDGNANLLLRSRPDGRYDVVHDSTSSGPPKVSTPEFRAGWDRIFGTKREVGQA